MKDYAVLSVRDLRLIALSALARSLRTFSGFDDTGSFNLRREPPPLLRLRTEEEEAAEVRDLVNQIFEDRPLARAKLLGANTLVQRILDAREVENAQACLLEVRSFAGELLGNDSETESANTHASYKSIRTEAGLRIEAASEDTGDDDIQKRLTRDIEEQRFIASVMRMCRRYRAENLTFGPDDEVALERAYRLLDEGVRLPRVYEPIRHTPERAWQTYLSFADPGDGHLAVTVRKKELLDGTIVHIEYIDRDNVASKSLVEAYRLPAVRNAARVRLHVGNSTPCTAFIGRPVFEGNDFELGLLKAGHTMASVCSAMFGHGIADCKVAMDGMTARQAVEFMRVVAGNVVRDPLNQSLSAAFNVNTELDDDLTSRGTRRVKEPFAIASLAVQLAKLGKFNKVAWDGASDSPPSLPIIGRLSRVQLLEVIHAAHERGLETYISAGMKAEHMRDAVYIGVGGVGIGTSLHYMDPGTKSIGEIDPAKVREVLGVQKAAFQTVAGRAGGCLAQLDWRYAEGSLRPELNLQRHSLYKALSDALGTIDAAHAANGAEEPDIPYTHAAVLTGILETIDSYRAEPEPVMRMRKKGGAAKMRGSMRGSRRDTADRTSVEETKAHGDTAISWAERVLAAYNSVDKTERDSFLEPGKAADLKRLVEAGDADTLRLLYPL